MSKKLRIFLLLMSFMGASVFAALLLFYSAVAFFVSFKARLDVLIGIAFLLCLAGAGAFYLSRVIYRKLKTTDEFILFKNTKFIVIVTAITSSLKNCANKIVLIVNKNLM